MRTNFFQERAGGEPHDYVSMKFDPQAIPDLPPRPACPATPPARGRGRSPP
ncbi:NAD-glutamate dehydrogenase domain-containing protein [Streptomyces sp. NPDC005859]|uniref:NAD-glutamate dehydrogenase domain-containing protein n=1 Tax=Streptomyces sp. NPDC005859 TaxID=3157170 RepID=UPI0033EF0E54